MLDLKRCTTPLVFAASALLLALAIPAAAIELVSASPTGKSGSYRSDGATVSGNGRYVVWISGATNFLADIGACDVPVQGGTIFLRDNLTKTVEQVGQTGAVYVTGDPAISRTGRYVVYSCNAPPLPPTGPPPSAPDICVLDRDTATVDEIPNEADDDYRVSADGRFIAYQGHFPGNTGSQILVYDRCVSDGTPVPSCTAGKELVSVNTVGGGADDPYTDFPDMSDDGRFVVFGSGDHTLVAGVTTGSNIFVRDRCVSGNAPVPSCTPNTRRVNVADDGSTPTGNCSAYGAISNDGRYVAFYHCAQLTADASDEFHVYVRDRDLDGNGVFDEAGPSNTKTELVSKSTAGSPGDFGSSRPDISGDGRYVVFPSGASNLASPPTPDLTYNIYLRDLVAQTTTRISTSPTGEPAHYPEGALYYYMDVSISDDGHIVTFDSQADNLVPKKPNVTDDIYLWADCAAAAPTCGDSIVYYGCEECDDGGTVDETNGCDSNCQLTGCPNGAVTAGEVCDDGNAVSGDGCDTNCTTTACGNGIRSPGEACDDGNTASGDDCSPTCSLELAKLIPGAGSSETDCLHEWRTDPAPGIDPKGFPRRELRCTDDDPSCDFGASGDHACTFHVALCFNVEDSRLVAPACTPDAIEVLTLKKPKEEEPKNAVETAVRDALEAEFQGVGACIVGECSKPASSVGSTCEVDDDCDDFDDDGNELPGTCKGRFGALYDWIEETNHCTDYTNLVVPLKEKNGRYSKGKQTLLLRVDPILDQATGEVRPADSDKLKLTCAPIPAP